MTDSKTAEIYLPAGHFHGGGGNVRVHTLLGSCVAIALWHPSRRFGAICHYLLPSRRPNTAVDDGSKGLYADEVMGLFRKLLAHTNTAPGDYLVKIAGGGNMFPEQTAGGACRDGACRTTHEGCASVGCRNIAAARGLLAAEGFSIAAQNVGGVGSRQVIFDLATGDLWVKRGAAMSAATGVAA